MKKLKVLYIIWGLIVVLIIAGLTTLGYLYQKKLKPYKDGEKKLINYDVEPILGASNKKLVLHFYSTLYTTNLSLIKNCRYRLCNGNCWNRCIKRSSRCNLNR